jgi:hypothetical protein
VYCENTAHIVFTALNLKIGSVDVLLASVALGVAAAPASWFSELVALMIVLSVSFPIAQACFNPSTV